MSIALTITLLLAGAIAGGIGGWIVAGFHHRLKALEDEKRQREAVAVDARGRMRAHHAYSTLAAIEDSTSLLMDAAMEVEAMQARISTTISILKVLHESPTGYEPKKSEK